MGPRYSAQDAIEGVKTQSDDKRALSHAAVKRSYLAGRVPETGA